MEKNTERKTEAEKGHKQTQLNLETGDRDRQGRTDNDQGSCAIRAVW